MNRTLQRFILSRPASPFRYRSASTTASRTRLPTQRQRGFAASAPLRMGGGGSSPPQLQNVAVSVDNGIALIKYNRPKVGNALNTEVIKDIGAALKWADESDEVRVIVQTGEGRFYTAGLDLLDKSVADKESVIGEEFRKVLSGCHKTMINSDKVLIAGVNGPAPGWGTSSLALSDLVYATPDSFFFTPFIQWGLCAEACSSVTFASIMGHQKAAGLILAGERMTAQELETAGLVTKVLPKENFLEEVMKVADRIAKLPPNTLRFNKSLMMRTKRKELLEANEIEIEGLRTNGSSQESWTAIKTFEETQAKKKKEKEAQKSRL